MSWSAASFNSSLRWPSAKIHREFGRPPEACGTNRALLSGRQLASWRSVSLSFSRGTSSVRSPPDDDTRSNPPSPVVNRILPSGHHAALLPPTSWTRTSAMTLLSPPPAGALKILPPATYPIALLSGDQKTTLGSAVVGVTIGSTRDNGRIRSLPPST